MTTQQSTHNTFHPKTLLVGIFTSHNQISTPEQYYEEFLSLVQTLGLPYDATYFMKLRATDNNMFLTTGKLEELKQECIKENVERLVISELLSPIQERNLERALGCEIWDREKIILEIFKKSAHSSEGKIQVEMAEIEYLKTRTMGKGRDFSQQEGIIGTRGPGETAKEDLKRQFADLLRQSKKRLETLERSREVQRKKRLDSHIPLICIIGYTNAGKSSLLNRIAKGEVLAEDKLFATLDTTTRELFIDGKKKALISDTVGFINELPHNLIAAFKSTLDELHYANVLLHVIDISNPAWQGQIAVVEQTLKELDVDKPVIYVFNKIDKLTEESIMSLSHSVMEYQPQVFIHTKSKEGITPLIEVLRDYRL
jgi:GTP-binding protein HflX